MDALDLLKPSDPASESGGASEVGRPNGAAPFMVDDLLGHEAGFDPGRGLSPVERLRQGVRSGFAVLASPRPAGVVVSGIGVLILLFVGYLYFFTALSEQRSQHVLLQSVTAEPAATYNLTSGAIPREGRAVAVLEIPALNLVDAVVQGTNAQDLRSGPGHMPTTALPGQPGNAVIAGRRVTYGGPFGALGSLRRGDVIHVVDGYGVFRYRVERVLTVGVGQRDVVTPTSSNRLTLVTAGPGLVPSGRLAVIAGLIGAPLKGTVAPTFRAVPAQLGLDGDSASGVLALAWGALFLVLLALMAWFLRHWSQPVVVYLLGVPLLVAVGLFACQSVAGFLPATF
jgi:sortase A